ncbi:MAG: class I SAM-dependent methyltransferase [Actinomycetota bacterium]|nr:class I SAM-dependent methyltransferase [Actinomycetota bacterium]
MLYGRDPAGYGLGRPRYPAELYELLVARCGLGSGCRTVEIGPGTGVATRRLLDLGAEVTAVEPNEAMATYLSQTLASRLELVVAPFEVAPLSAERFDLAVAGTSFHWVPQPAGFRQLRRVLRPGGATAIWWMLFEDPRQTDAVTDLVGSVAGRAPGMGSGDEVPFQLDAPARRAELADAGFENVDSEVLWSALVLTPRQTRVLYASFAALLRLPSREREPLLDRIEDIVSTAYGGLLERQVPTAVYTATRPQAALSVGPAIGPSS